MKKKANRVKPPQPVKDGLLGLYGHLLNEHGHIEVEFHIVKHIANIAGYLAVQRTISSQRWDDSPLLLSFDTLSNREKCLLYFDAEALHKAFESDRRAVMGQAPAMVK